MMRLEDLAVSSSSSSSSSSDASDADDESKQRKNAPAKTKQPAKKAPQSSTAFLRLKTKLHERRGHLVEQHPFSPSSTSGSKPKGKAHASDIPPGPLPKAATDAPLLRLPPEVLVHILSYLPSSARFPARRVCRSLDLYCSLAPACVRLPRFCSDEQLELLLLLFPRVNSLELPAIGTSLSRKGWQQLRRAPVLQHVWPSDGSQAAVLARYAAGLVSAFARCPRWAPGSASCAQHPALRCLSQALQLQPGNITLMRSRARLLRHLGLYELAAEAYDALVRALPKDYKTLLRRGRVLARLGRHEQALGDVNEAVRLRPYRMSGYLRRATLLAGMRRWEDALRDASLALERKPRSRVLRRLRADIYAHLGRWEAAVRDFSVVIDRCPADFPALMGRAFAYEKWHKPEKALHDLDRALALRPRSASALCARGRVLRQLGRMREALADLSRCLQISLTQLLRPDESVALAARAAVYISLKDASSALPDYDALLRLDPCKASTHAYSAYALATLGRQQEAFDAYDRSLALHDNPDVRRQREKLQRQSTVSLPSQHPFVPSTSAPVPVAPSSRPSAAAAVGSADALPPASRTKRLSLFSSLFRSGKSPTPHKDISTVSLSQSVPSSTASSKPIDTRTSETAAAAAAQKAERRQSVMTALFPSAPSSANKRK